MQKGLFKRVDIYKVAVAVAFFLKKIKMSDARNKAFNECLWNAELYNKRSTAFHLYICICTFVCKWEINHNFGFFITYWFKLYYRLYYECRCNKVFRGTLVSIIDARYYAVYPIRTCAFLIWWLTTEETCRHKIAVQMKTYFREDGSESTRRVVETANSRIL